MKLEELETTLAQKHLEVYKLIVHKVLHVYLIQYTNLLHDFPILFLCIGGLESSPRAREKVSCYVLMHGSSTTVYACTCHARVWPIIAIIIQ